MTGSKQTSHRTRYIAFFVTLPHRLKMEKASKNALACPAFTYGRRCEKLKQLCQNRARMLYRLPKLKLFATPYQKLDPSSTNPAEVPKWGLSFVRGICSKRGDS